MAENESTGQSEVQGDIEDDIPEHLEEAHQRFLRGEQQDDRLLILLLLFFFALALFGYLLMNPEVAFEAAETAIAL